MIEVRIRHEDSDKSQHLTNVQFSGDAMEQAIRLVKEYGCAAEGDMTCNAYGQFVIAPTTAYFEIVVTA